MSIDKHDYKKKGYHAFGISEFGLIEDATLRGTRRFYRAFLKICLVFKLILAIQISVLNGFRDVIDLKVRLCL